MNGIYWDCDGTLMDTETSYGLAWKEHLSDFGLEISEEETRQWVGIDDRLVHSFYAKNVDLENFEKTMASLGKIIEGTLNEKLLFQDAKILLEETNNRGWTSACVSASPYELLKNKLIKANIFDYFSYVIGGDQVERNKPYPDIYNKAISELQTTKNIVIEDSPPGISSGKASGSYVVAIDRGIFSEDELNKADLIVDNLSIDIIETVFNSL
jgi:beta-phosphoglucomutase-like phosphatase (HAD superfamily)|tara:strand:+ start:3026 stop:3661 length:636 start_codon:yes stop_codon:yes gene_type:complete